MRSLKEIKSSIKIGAMKAFSKGQMLLLALAALTFIFSTGCATTEDDNLTERPWNSPKSWETGLPQGMMQGR
jgi:hypothetical protein